MTRILFILTLALGAAVVPTAQAEAASEQVKNRKAELKEAKKDLKNDEKDFKKLVKIVEGWRGAWEDQNHDKEAKWDSKLTDWLAVERAENREDIQEARQDVNEAGGARRENRAENELELEQKRARRVREIVKELKEVQKKFYPQHRAKRPAHEKKAQLLRDLRKAAKRDVQLRTEAVAAAERRLEQAKNNS